MIRHLRPFSCTIVCDGCGAEFGPVALPNRRPVLDAAGDPVYVLTELPTWRGRPVNHVCHRCLGHFLADLVQRLGGGVGVWPGGVAVNLGGAP